MARKGRPDTRWALAVYLLALVLVAVALGESDRLPIPAWTAAGFVTAHVAVGFVIGRWGSLFLGLGATAASVGAAAIEDNVLYVVLGLIILTPVAMALIALGVGLRKLRERRVHMTRGRAIALVSIVPLALGLGLAVVERNVTVRADRPQPVPIDERAGTVGGVGLGDSATAVEAHFGHDAKRTDDDGTGPVDGVELGSPSSIEGPPGGHDTFLRYRHVAFWLGRGRVWTIETVDHAARTSRGVGPGDSMKLVRRAYPGLSCSEDSVGSDEPIPYPSCTGQTGPRTWIYFGGDYTKPGAPVTSITLAQRQIF